jgi:N-acetylglucosamine kinase-like BadF-type ATPase
VAVVLGVDGGGTKTHVLVTDLSGRVVGSGTGGPSNWEDVGIVGAGETLRAAVLEAIQQAGVPPLEVVGCVFGLAGMDWDADHRRMHSLPDSFAFGGPSDVVNDSFVALRAGASHPWGVVVIAGTGAICGGRNRAGETFRTFGLGWEYGDFGSATDVSFEGVRAVAEAATGKGPPTALGDAMCAETAQSSVLQLLEELSRGRLDATRFGPLVVQAASSGDEVARAILERAGDSLGRSAAAVIRRLEMQDDEFEIVLSGGMLRGASESVRSALEDVLRPLAPRATFVRLRTAPVVGAVLLAMEAAGLSVDPELHQRLAEDAIERFHLEPR